MVFISNQLPDAYAAHLRAGGISCIPLPADPRLSLPVASHPDMLLFLGDHTLITDQVYYQLAKKEIDLACTKGLCSLTLTNEPPQANYPGDIRFNAAQVGHYLFCHPMHTSPSVLAYAQTHTLTLIPIQQGYARCSLCPVGDRALITSDQGIAKAAKKHDLDVLLIHQGHVMLPGYSYGFIGGCCGSLGHRLFFCGDPLLHPSGDAILAFVQAHGYEPITMPGLPLYDSGSLLFIPSE